MTVSPCVITSDGRGSRTRSLWSGRINSKFPFRPSLRSKHRRSAPHISAHRGGLCQTHLEASPSNFGICRSCVSILADWWSPGTMCSGGCAKCVGITLIPLAVLSVLANILQFFPGGKTVSDNNHITDEVWFFGGLIGSGVLMIFPALVFLGLKNNDCCGCCGNESCGKRFAMFSSIIFAAVGVIGAGYCFIISAVAINKGPKCLIATGNWSYPFFNGDYLGNHTMWSACEKPDDVIPWNLTLFSILLIMSGVQAVLCAIQAVNGLIGTICGDCNCCGCCGGDGPV